MAEIEVGIKWWMRYVIVPVIGGGGVIALIVAFLSQPGKPTGAQTSQTSFQSIPPPVKGGAGVGTTFQYAYTKNDGSLECLAEYAKVSATEWYERPSAGSPVGCLADAANFRYTERQSDDPNYILLYDEGRSLFARFSNTELGQSGPTEWRLISNQTWNASRSVKRVK